MVRPLHLLGVVCDSLCRRREGEFMVGEVLQVEGLWQRDLRIKLKLASVGPAGREEMNFVADHHCEAVRDDIGCDS